MTLDFPDDTPMGKRFKEDLRMLANLANEDYHRDDVFEVMHAVHISRVKYERLCASLWDAGHVGGLA